MDVKERDDIPDVSNTTEFFSNHYWAVDENDDIVVWARQTYGPTTFSKDAIRTLCNLDDEAFDEYDTVLVGEHTLEKRRGGGFRTQDGMSLFPLADYEEEMLDATYDGGPDHEHILVFTSGMGNEVRLPCTADFEFERIEGNVNNTRHVFSDAADNLAENFDDDWKLATLHVEGESSE